MFEPIGGGLLEAADVLDIIALSFLLLLVMFTVFILCIQWRMLRVQREILFTLKEANKTNAEMLETFEDIRSTPPPPTSGRNNVSAPAQEADDEDETPADFVYCPVCSTRVEVDPSIRNVNVVCPDCKKPFHIH